jgi:hypothetical protein
MRNESGFWSCIYHLFILFQFVESMFSKTTNMVFVILLSLMLSKICCWVSTYECAAVMCLSSPIYQSCFPYIHLCGLIVLVNSCNFIYSVNLHPDSCVFSVVCYNRTCKVTLCTKLESLRYLAKKALKCSFMWFAKVMCELLVCINKRHNKFI